MNKKYILTLLPLLLLGGCGQEKEESKTTVATSSSSTNVQTSEFTITSSTDIYPLPDMVLREEEYKVYEKIETLPSVGEKQNLANLSMVIMIQPALIKTREYNGDFVADIQNKDFYLYPWQVERFEPDSNLSTNDIEEIRTILEDCNVQNWKERYGEATDPTTTADIGVWYLYLVFNDNTIESHSGYSPDTDEPAELDTLHEKLMDFRDQKRQEWQKENAN
ncbi:hypothetical protein [Enterococcus sp. LJL51]|uniref:hypothetical protein n=1 Tax=Enterococcus sp. LJL51 TaxID=3416656 RepID=UPI003CF856A2